MGCATVSLCPAVAPATSPRSGVSGGATGSALFHALDAKIEEGMKAYAIPGAAVGVLLDDQEYIKG